MATGRSRAAARPSAWIALSAIVASALLAGAGAPPPSAAPVRAADVRPAAPNPPIAESCGIDVNLVLDASGSISSAHAVDTVREAARSFLDALADTNSSARVVDFATFVRQTAPMTLVTAASVSQGGVLGQAVDKYYNPQPPKPSGVTGHRFNGGNVNSTSSYSTGSDVMYTNWDGSLKTAGTVPSDLIVFLTDGEPNGALSDHPGDPFYVAGDTTPDVRYKLDSTQPARDLSLDRAVEKANLAKAAGARILAVGVGDAFGSSAAVDRLKAVSGPQVVTDASTITSLNDVDVALVKDFDELAGTLRQIVTELCSPSLTIRKLTQTPGSAEFTPAAGWSITANPTVATGSVPPYSWILPVAGAPVGPKTLVTDANGYAQFQWEPEPPTATTTATVSETDQADHTPQDWSCEAKNPDGSVVKTSGTLDAAAAQPSFDVTVGPQQIVTCAIRNAFDYAPDATVTKVNSPTIVRGDGQGTAVVSTYTATNTGNTPLSPVAGTDDQCAPVEPVTSGGVIVGDTNDNGLVDPGETWTIRCTRTVQHALTDDDVVIDNTVTLSGRAPDGQLVTRSATDDVQVLTPNIVVTKSASPTSGVAPLDAVYTYTVHTDGNTPLADVTLDDDTAPCSTAANIDFTGGDTANAGYLDPGETWTYTCAATGITENTVNTVVASGQPVTPAPALDPIGSRVRDTATAEVTVLDAQLALTKSADPTVGLPGLPVTYTFEVSNPAAATATLVPPATTTRADLVADDTCSPVTYASGDTGDDSRLEPGETWTYTCAKTYPDPGAVLNRATVIMQVEGDTTQLTRHAIELVKIVPPRIDLAKQVSEGLVHDGDTVTYTYQATNPGTVPLQDVTVTDDAGPGTCSPVTYVSGDDGNGLLDPGELWEYTCSTAVSKPAPSTTPATIKNTATVVGTPVLDGQTAADVTATASAEVVVIQPAIHLAKTATPTELRPGGTVTWTVTATNTGDSPLFLPAVSDDTCAPLAYQSGDTGADGVMDPGEAWVYTCAGIVSADTTNTATVTADDPLGAIVTDTATATVTVFSPSISLTKTVSADLVPSGDSVDYTFVATNTGDDPLTDVTLTDSRCTALAGPSGDTGGDLVMDPGEVWTWTCSRAIDAPTVNLAAVHATDHAGGAVADFGIASVVPFTSGIHVVKTADPTILYGPGSVTYHYAVTNTGEVPLADVAARITDDTCADVTYVSGDTDGNELLTGPDDIFETGPAETWHFTCTTDVAVDTTNTVTVTGTPTGNGSTIGPDVTDTDTATVNVVQLGSITIVKDIQGEGDGSFAFSGDLGAFTLDTVNGTASTTFTGVRPGTYRVAEDTATGWKVLRVACGDPTGDTTIGATTATIHLAEAEDVTCMFTNLKVVPAPETAVGPGGGAPPGGIIAALPVRDPWPPVLLLLVGVLSALALMAWRRSGASLRRRGPGSRARPS